MLFKNRKSYVLNFALILALLGGLFGTVPVRAITHTVTTINDSGAGSLRQAIADAASGGIITFDPSLGGQTITLASELFIDKNLTIDGSGLSPQVTISGGNVANLTVSSSYVTVTISDLTISNGYSSGHGGAIVSFGNLIVINSTLRNNHALGTGGAISSTWLMLKDTTITQNQAGGYGGALSVQGNSSLTIVNSTVTQNQAGNGGGAIFMNGNAYGEIFNSTFAGNNAPQGREVQAYGNGTLDLFNTIMACTTGNDSCYNTFVVNTTSSILGIGTLADFGLSELADNGGSTQTMALLPDSPLIDAGNDTACENSPVSSLDQRRATRPEGAHCDIGAYEYLGTISPSPSLLFISGNTGIGEVSLYYSNGMITSDVSGNYSLIVPYGWSGIVTPYKSGYRLTPASRSYTNVQADQAAQDYAATRLFTISGNAGVGGAVLSYVDGSLKTVTAPSSGNYSFQVPEHWSGAVTPSRPGYVFSPTGRTYDDLVTDQFSQNYTVTIAVTNSNDSGPGSLRQAIIDASSGATIYFDPALAGQTITLASTLTIQKSITIDGAGLNPRVEISGGNAVRIFLVDAASTIAPTMKNIVLKDGKQTGLSYTYFGGAMFIGNDTTLTLENVLLTNNSAYSAGAIYISPYAVVTISNSEITGNRSDAEAGAILVKSIGILNLRGSVISNNISGTAGAIYFTGATNSSIVENNLFADNSAMLGGAITGQLGNARIEIRNNLFTGNHATGTNQAGGAVYFSASTIPTLVILENNSFYNNVAAGIGGGAYLAAAADFYLINNSFSNNMATTGGNLYLSGGASIPRMYNNIIANNAGGGDCHAHYNSYIYGSNNLIEDGSPTCFPAITGDPMLGSLANNGGSTQTMALLPGSPAIDAGDGANCPSTDQRGVARPQGNGCDVGAFEFVPPPTATPTNTPTNTPTFTPTYTPTATPLYSYNSLYVSLTGNQTIGGVASADEDILSFDGTNWSLFFDGSDVGVGGSDLFGFSFVDADSLLLSFNTALTLNGISVTPRDVLRFDATSLGSNTAGTFSMYLNGIDVGLDVAAENIDSVSMLPDGRVLISTTGNPVVAGVTGAKDEDVLAFTPTTLGNNTSGSWTMYFDGSDVGLGETSSEDVDALDVTSNGNIYLSTTGDFSVTGVSGADEDVFVCEPNSVGDVTACNYSPSLYFDGSTWNLSANDVDAFNFLIVGPVSTSTPTPTNTPTPTKTPTATATVTNGPLPTPTYTPTSTSTLTATFTPTATNTSGSSDLIFADGFESGSLSAWTSSATNGGDLSVSAPAALKDNQGMQALINDNNTISVTDDSPNAEPRYRVRFYFDPNSIPMLSGDAHFIFKAFMGTSTEVMRLEFRQSSGVYQIRHGAFQNDSSWIYNNWITISDAPHSIELDWFAATTSGPSNGSLSLWIDGGGQFILAGVDNGGKQIDSSRLGALTGIDNGTRGTYYFDAFESRRQNYIGP